MEKRTAAAASTNEWSAVVAEGVAMMIYHSIAASAVVVTATLSPQLTAMRLIVISLTGTALTQWEGLRLQLSGRVCSLSPSRAVCGALVWHLGTPVCSSLPRRDPCSRLLLTHL